MVATDAAVAQSEIASGFAACRLNTENVRDNRAVARSNVPPVKIIVDIHERQSGIAETLAELGAEVEVAALPAGDYVVGADTLVERKRVLDLHAAVLNGRLWPQLGKLRGACAFPYLLVEGPILIAARSTTTRSEVSALRSSTRGSPSCAAVTNATRRYGSTVSPSVASSSSPPPTGQPTGSGPGRSQVRRRPKRFWPRFPASRPRLRAPSSSVSAA